jgi:hypothetical protein
VCPEEPALAVELESGDVAASVSGGRVVMSRGENNHSCVGECELSKIFSPARVVVRSGAGTYYMVSGGPMIMISHSKTLTSSMSPAEKPSMGFRLSSAAVDARWVGTSESEGRGGGAERKKGR